MFFFNPGPERSVIKWFLDKKMVITAFRKVNIELHKLNCLIEFSQNVFLT